MSPEQCLAAGIVLAWSAWVGLAVVMRVTRWAWSEHRRYFKEPEA